MIVEMIVEEFMIENGDAALDNAWEYWDEYERNSYPKLGDWLLEKYNIYFEADNESNDALISGEEKDMMLFLLTVHLV